MLLVLAAIWGAAFMLIEIALRDLAPESVAAGRIALAALTLLAVALARRVPGTLARLRAHAGRLALAGALNTAIPFVLIPWGQQWIESGTAAILNGAAPLFTVLFAAAAVRTQRVTGLRLVGFVIGFGGVALVVGAGDAGGSVRAVEGSLAVVAAAALYAFGALYTGQRLRALSPLEVSLGTMAFATLYTLPLGLAGLRGHELGWEAAASVAVLGVVATAIAYLLYFGLIAGAGASRAILVTYLVPGLALVYGATLLDEEVTVRSLAGLALVLGGVALGTGAIGRGAMLSRRSRRSASAAGDAR